MSKKRKIIFAVPTNDRIEPETCLAIARICQREDVEYYAITGSPTDQVRNAMVRRLLQDEQATHLLMMDSDIIPPDNAVDLLLQCKSVMSTAIVPIMLAGMIVTNIGLNGRFLTNWSDMTEPFEVDCSGAGMILIERKVFEAVSWPWFRYEESEDEGKRFGEDLYFSKKAGDCGFRYKVNPKLVCDHIKKVKLMDIVKMTSRMNRDHQKQIEELRLKLCQKQAS